MNKRLTFLVVFCLPIFAINAQAQDCPDSCKYSIPNTLTPNCDGIDCDVLEVTSNCSFTEFDFKIYNRWGNIIFETTNPRERFIGGEHEEGTYLWQLKGEFCNEEEFESMGYINIIR